MKRTATIILTSIMLLGALALPAAAQLADPYDEVGGVVIDRPVPRVTDPAAQPTVTVPSPVRAAAPVTQVRPSAQLAQTGIPTATAGLLALGLLALGGMALGASRMRSAATA